jgi:DNA processing protein
MERLVPWLTLKSVPGIGNLRFRLLIRSFGSPEPALQAPADLLAQVEGITLGLAKSIQRQRTPDWVWDEIERCSKAGYTLITQNDPAYPALLLTIPDPPPVLYCNGRVERDWCHIAVVGSRRSTTYGRSIAGRLSRDLSVRGVCIVSGMARGIDSAAHRGALDAGGKTVAVLGSGLNRVYPPEHRSLFHSIAENGAVISEFPLDAAPEPHHFPQRNRIISGVALGTVVVEATRRSGSLITARLAAEQGREVFAVPGNINAPSTSGTHGLIRQGAKLVETAEDVIEELLPHVALPESPAATKRNPGDRRIPGKGLRNDQQKVFDAIAHDPVHIDDLVRRCKMGAGALTAILGELELMGAVIQEPGKFFMRGGAE